VKEYTLPLKEDTATILKGFFAGKMPSVKAFKVPDKPIDMLSDQRQLFLPVPVASTKNVTISIAVNHVNSELAPMGAQNRTF
jgi:hypothetical protein